MFSVLPQRVLLGVMIKTAGSHIDSVQARQLKPPPQILRLVHEAWSQPNFSPSKMYSFLNNDRHGDAIMRTPEPTVVSTEDPYELDLDFIDSGYFWSALQEFVAGCRSKGVLVYFAWPPVVKGKLDFHSPRVKRAVTEIMGHLQGMAIPFLGTPSNFQYDSGDFTDSLYHLSLQGRAEHTSRLLGYLMKEQGVFLVNEDPRSTNTSSLGTAHLGITNNGTATVSP